DAVADVGAYKSPGRASEFYKAMAKEIDSACKAGRLRCEKRLIPYMPRMTSEQIRVIPRSALTLIHDVVVPGTDPTPRVQNVTGSQEQFAATLDFLNHPSHFPLYDDSPTTQIDLSGWFHNPSAGAGWFKFTVSDRHSKSLSYNLIRESSPDLVESQHDPAATRQRFVLRTQCGPGCVLHFSDETGSRDIPVTDSTAFYKKFINLGRGLLAFDSGKVVYPTPTAKDVRVIVAGKVRAGLYAIYDILLPILLSIGVLAFFVNCYFAIRERSYTIAFVMATVCWTGIITRSVILVLIDVSSFPAMITPYLLPIYVLSVIASALSLIALREMVLRASQPIVESPLPAWTN